MKQVFGLLLIFIFFSGCQPQKKSTVRATTTTTANISNTLGLGGLSAQCGTTSSSAVLGAIYDDTQSLNQLGSFQDRVVSLLSATMYPEDIGQVSSLSTDTTTGVRFTGTIKLNTSGAVVSAQSNLVISIYDSIWQQNRISNPSEQPIKLTFNPSNGAVISGQFNTTNGLGYFTVQDQYGSVRFDGQYDAQYFSGTVTFQNTVSVSGTATSGGLGQFKTLTCGLFQK